MNEKEFLNGIANGKADVLQILLDIMNRESIAYCVIGGLAVNAYVEPVVSLDLDMVVAASSLMTLFLIKQRPFLFELNITHSNRGRFYSKSEVFNLQNGLNRTFPSK